MEYTSVFSQTGDFINILGMIGIALLTILIPIAVAIFNEKKESEFLDLDKNVVLDYVINAPFFIFYIASIYIPLLLWVVLPPCLRFFELLIWFWGVYLMIKILINSYHWMKGDKFRLRFDYLRELKEPKDMEGVWRSVWETNKINTQNERDFFIIFSKTIDSLLQNNGTKS